MAVTASGNVAGEAVSGPESSRPFPLRWSQAVLRFVRRKPLAATGGAIVLALLLVAIFANLIAPYGYDARDYEALLAGPSLRHLLGTDDVGRDIFSRIVYGARVSVIVGFGTVFVSSLVAGFVGIVSGYFGGIIDLIGQRIVDIWQSLPGLLLLLVFAAIFGTPTSSITVLPGPLALQLQPAEIRAAQIIFALGLILSGGTSRIYRSAVLAIRQRQYVEAARAVGASHPRVLFFYILPNVMPDIIVIATFQLGLAILIEAALSFLQFGIPPPVPDWGSMLSGSAQEYINRAPMLAVWPGLAIFLAVFGFNMFGDGLRDVLDPHMRGR